MTIINLFFVPILSVYLYYRFNKKEIAPTFAFGINWALACVAVSLVAKIILAVEQFLFMSAAAAIDSFKYTFAATVAAVLITVVSKVFRIKVGVQKDEK